MARLVVDERCGESPDLDELDDGGGGVGGPEMTPRTSQLLGSQLASPHGGRMG